MKRRNGIKLLPLMLLLLLLTACGSEGGEKKNEAPDAEESVEEDVQAEEPEAEEAVQAEEPETEEAVQVEEPEAEKVQTFAPKHIIEPCVSGDAAFYYKAEGKYLSVYNGEDFEEIYLKGVNLGLGKPGYFPGRTAITKEEYARWFKEISDMNANCIRVYTIQPPDFYEAFYEFNQTGKEPLYLFHGTWYDETRLAETADAFDEQLYTILQDDMRKLVDVLHGNCTIEAQPGKASGIYQYDISSYVIGWILGIESDADFVSTTNENHLEITYYEGTYICADDLEPFEVFWAQTGDYLLSYEMEKYGMQRPLSYCNWPTADILKHPSEKMGKEDRVDLNVENLQTTEAFQCGLFASYHIYPYYPNFMYTQKEYIDYRDEEGKTNTYKAYLEELIAQHDIPVVVAEFGIPASRGITHANIYTGFDQGNKTEEEQGEMLVSMMQDIHDTGYAGGIVFTWQDEWFKRIWNTEEYTNANRRAFWCDVMTCEQHFGILDFVPWENGQPTVTLDGNDDEWKDEDILLETKDAVMSVKYDCAYLYLMIKKVHADYDTDKLYISFDITPESGSYVYEQNSFSSPADFVMIIDGKENSQMLVHSYYDLYQFEHDEHDDEITTTEQMKQSDNDLFQPIYFFIEREMVLQDRDEIIPLQKFPAGELVYGISDYDSEEYNSIADFYYENDILEIRIPWLLLNFRDPSGKEIEGDFWANGWFCEMTIDGIQIGLSGEGERAEMKEFQWENWDYYPYFERLRKSYYMLQEQYENLEPVTTL